MTAHQLAQSIAQRAIQSGRARVYDPWSSCQMSEAQARYLSDLMRKESRGRSNGGGFYSNTARLQWQREDNPPAGAIDFTMDGTRLDWRPAEVLSKVRA